MKQSVIFLLLFLFLQPIAFAQRATKKSQPSNNIYQTDNFTGRYISVTLFNLDTVPVLLKLGPTRQLVNNDTLNLARTFPCSNPFAGEYYDLHDLVSWENSSVGWYTLQLIKPKDSIRFVVKLNGFDKSDTSRLYYCYTKEIKKIDRDLDLYADIENIYMQKEERNFKTKYITIDKHAPNSGFAISWQME